MPSLTQRIKRWRELRRKTKRQLERAHDRDAPQSKINQLRERARNRLHAIRKLRHLKKLPESPEAHITSGVTRFDGVAVAAWMVPYLKWARANGWKGRLVSGWRDPKYSQQLCYRMCGRPSCPGRCAGLSSNHVGSTKPKGAVDVSDYYRFGQLMRSCPLQPRLFNALGSRDPVHFSASGR